MTFIAVAIVSSVGISTKTLLMFHNTHITIRKSQAFNIKENYIKDVTVDSQNVHENDADKDLNLLSDAKNSSDSSQYDNGNTTNQKTITSKSKKSSSNNDTNKQEFISSNLKKSSNNNDTNKQTATSSQLKNANSNVNTKNNDSTNVTLEVKKPTIHYDRTTSIYANDNITLLRIEYYINNKLTYYSVIEQFNATTKSYIEKIYQCNRETNIDPLIRTDVYVNGNLIKSY